MNSTFGNRSLFQDDRNTFIQNAGGNEDFMKWMSSVNPLLFNKYPSLSKQSQIKLRSLFYLNLQADSSVDEVMKSISRLECEYEALTKRNLTRLQLLGISDDLSSETQMLLQESGALVMQGHVGDGTDAAAGASLAVDFLSQANAARQRSGLIKDIQILQKRNERLKETLQYFEREYKLSAEEVSAQQTMLDSLNVDLNVSQAKLSKLDGTVSSISAELDKLGVSPAISDQSILDLYQTYNSLLKEINLLNKKLEIYGELPPSVTGATTIISKTEQRLEAVADALKLKHIP